VLHLALVQLPTQTNEFDHHWAKFRRVLRSCFGHLQRFDHEQ
jgi:hypothetical protein